MLYLDCRMLEGSGISTYLSNLIQQFRSNHSKIQLNYLVKRYSNLISQAPDYPGQHLYQSKILEFARLARNIELLKDPNVKYLFLINGNSFTRTSSIIE